MADLPKMKITDVRNSDYKRIEIENDVYLISKHGIAIRTKTFIEKEFHRAPIENGVAQHLKYEDSFEVEGKIVKVTAECKTSFGPLGDRISLHVTYDGIEIGNYRALRSYMGGGSNGKWPILYTANGVIVFTLNASLDGPSSNLFRIEHFQTIITDTNKQIDPLISKVIHESTIAREYLKNTFTINEIEEIKQLIWVVPIRDSNKEIIGKISCLRFPGFERYRKVYYGTYNPKNKPDISFIGRCSPDSGFYVLSFEKKNFTEYYFPWREIWITHQFETE